MENRCNLLDVPFIRTAGECHRLEDVFSGRTKALCGTPEERLSIMYFLLGLCQYFSTPDTYEAWKEMGAEGLGRNVLEGLPGLRDFLYVIGDNPFMQHKECAVRWEDSIAANEWDKAETRDKKEKDCQRDYPSGYLVKSQSVFTPREFTGSTPLFMNVNIPNESGRDDGDLIRYILTYMGQAAHGGKKASNTFPPNVKAKTKNVGGGPALAGSNGSMHCFVGSGNSLLEDLWLNLLTKEDLAGMPQFEGGLGIPYFLEKPVDQNDPVPGRPELRRGREKSLLGIYLPMPRFFLLGENIVGDDGGTLDGKAAVCKGVLPAPGLFSPFCMMFWKTKDKKKMLSPYVPPNGYRFSQEIQALFLIKRDGSLCPGLKLCMERMCGLNDPNIRNLHLHVMGVSVSNKAGEQYYSGRDDVFSANVSAPLEAVTSSGWFTDLQEAFGTLVRWEGKLSTSVSKYCKDIGRSNDYPSQKKKAVELYWRYIEPFTLNLVRSCASREQMGAVMRKCRSKLYRAYEDVCPANDARRMKAMYSHFPLKQKSTVLEDVRQEDREIPFYIEGIVEKALSLEDTAVRSALRRAHEENAESLVKAFLTENGLDEETLTRRKFVFEAYRTVLSAALKNSREGDGECGLVEVLWACSDDKEHGAKRVYELASSNDGLDLCRKLSDMLGLIAKRSGKRLSYERLLKDLLANRWFAGSLARSYYNLVDIVETVGTRSS